MKILISTILSTKRRTGVAVYLENLIQHLQKIDSQNEYFLLVSNENIAFFPIEKKNFHHIQIKIFEFSRLALRIQYYIIHKFIIPKLLKAYKIDIFHMPCPWFLSSNFPTIVTIHDLVEINQLKYFIFLNWIKRKMIISSLKNSKTIITVSENSAIAIRKKSDKEVNTIRHGVPKVNFDEYNEEKFNLEDMNLEVNKYFVFVGTLLRHKNLTTLVDSFIKFLKTEKDYKLILIGKKDNGFPQIKNTIKKYKNNIIATGYMGNNLKKNYLIKNATALILPSHEEGFGLPILEANLLETPVITANFSAMKEIANDAALLVDTSSVEEIFNAMITISSNNELRHYLISKGKENIRKFSWDKAAQQTICAYLKTLP